MQESHSIDQYGAFEGAKSTLDRLEEILLKREGRE